MRNIITWTRGIVLRNRPLYFVVTVLTLGHYHTYQCGWEAGIDFDIGIGK